MYSKLEVIAWCLVNGISLRDVTVESMEIPFGWKWIKHEENGVESISIESPTESITAEDIANKLAELKPTLSGQSSGFEIIIDNSATEDGQLVIDLLHMYGLREAKDLPFYQLKKFNYKDRPTFFNFSFGYKDEDIATNVRKSLNEISKLMEELLKEAGAENVEDVVSTIAGIITCPVDSNSFTVSMVGNGYSVKRKLDNNIFIHVFPFDHGKPIPKPENQFVYKGEINGLQHLMMVRHSDYDITKYCRKDCQKYFAQMIADICPFSKSNFIFGINNFQLVE